MRRGAAAAQAALYLCSRNGQTVRLMNETVSDISAPVCDRGNDTEGLGEHKRFPFCVKIFCFSCAYGLQGWLISYAGVCLCLNQTFFSGCV